MKVLIYDENKKIHHIYSDIYVKDYKEINNIKFINNITFEAMHKKNNDEKKIHGMFMTDDLYYEITKKGYKRHLTNDDLDFIDIYNNGFSFFKPFEKIKRFLKHKLKVFFHAAIMNRKVYIDYEYIKMYKIAEIEYKKTLKELDEIKKRAKESNEKKKESSIAANLSATKKTKRKRVKTHELVKKSKDK